jgi:hypothetical protein
MAPAVGHFILGGTLTAVSAQAAIYRRVATSTATLSQLTSCTACGNWRAPWQRSMTGWMHWKVSAAHPFPNVADLQLLACSLYGFGSVVTLFAAPLPRLLRHTCSDQVHMMLVQWIDGTRRSSWTGSCNDDRG